MLFPDKSSKLFWRLVWLARAFYSTTWAAQDISPREYYCRNRLLAYAYAYLAGVIDQLEELEEKAIKKLEAYGE